MFVGKDRPLKPASAVAVPLIFFIFLAGFIATLAKIGHAASDTTTLSYVSSTVCADCHQTEHAAWSTSHHSWALRLPTPETVLGDFNDATFQHQGNGSRFFSRDGKFFIETDSLNESPAEFEVKYVVGVEPLQQYLVETRNGRLQALDLAWDKERQRWFHLYPDENAKVGDGRHWTGPYKNWQARCATCHQTNFKKNYDQNTDGYQSTWSELTVGCEACHGAGEAHVLWAQSPESYNPNQFSEADSRGLLIAFLDGKAGQKKELDTCAGCHALREALDPDTPPIGADFNDQFNLALLRPGTYHADGQIDAEVYVYGSFLQSKMHANGVKCSNCHEVHSGNLIAEGNGICTQCHNPQGREEFPTLPLANYDTVGHHKHPQGTEGAQCVSCHMPAKTYMLVDPRRDHSFRVPRPDLSVKVGTPNSCTNCHGDQSAKWAADQVLEWFPNGRTDTPHFGEVLKAAEVVDNPKTSERLLELAKDQKTPGIVRATAVTHLAQRLNEQVARELLLLLGDREPLVRAAAVRALTAAPAGLRGRFVASLMNDDIRLVRQQAARVTMDLPLQGLDQNQLKIVTDARNDYQRTLQGRFDFPETQLQIAGMSLIRRNLPAARAAFNTAVRLDPQLIDAWMTLSRIAFVEDGPKAAATLLQSAIEKNPDSAILKQSLGNVYLEQGLFDKGLEAFEQARALEPDEPSIPHDIARLHIAAKKPGLAVAELEKTRARGILIPELLEVLVIAYTQTGDLVQAAEIAKDLQAKYPAFRAGKEVQAILDAIR